MGIDVYGVKFARAESETLAVIAKVFEGERFTFQYAIGSYRLDMYFDVHKIAVECDEHDHPDYDPVAERERTRYIDQQLSCRWARYNPDSRDFDVCLVLNQIFRLITCSSHRTA